ncbi:hypothetical protein DAQ1742_00458 [Dickeya aquatica]|uniref:Uncharacterized protein n=1 Tax=Dickeya aquatica TaxID=1401087 RepID=A0A375A7D8_9GAMM|nr:hypothetical protein DAQ1742_00458 [Dickeya aquatica]
MELVNRCQKVFPAPAGINRPGSRILSLMPSVPRASGDKPVQIITDNERWQCSPRQRG